jgi:hypothetical protein
MKSIICDNNIGQVIEELALYCSAEGKIGGMKLVDRSSGNVVILVSDEPITDDYAKGWWAGYETQLG